MNEAIKEWINSIDVNDNKEKIIYVVKLVQKQFPNLSFEIKWNQLFIINNKKFIIAIASYKKHLSIALDKEILSTIKNNELNKYESTNNLFKITLDQEIDKNLFIKIIKLSLQRDDNGKFW